MPRLPPEPPGIPAGTNPGATTTQQPPPPPAPARPAAPGGSLHDPNTLTTTSSERQGHDRTRELSAEELHQAPGLGIRQIRRMEKRFADVI